MIRWLAATAIAALALSACEPGAPSPDSTGADRVSQERAAALFVRYCAICHGENGDGHGPRRGSLFRKPPDFRDPAWRAGRTVEGEAARIRDGVPGTDMPSWRRLDDAEIRALSRYVLGLAHEPS